MESARLILSGIKNNVQKKACCEVTDCGLVLPTICRVSQKAKERISLMDNKQARAFAITINNPQEHGLTREMLIKTIELFSVMYACLCYEIGASGTEHVHIYLKLNGGCRFSTIKNRFGQAAHIEVAMGTAKENKDYMLKQGKFAAKADECTTLRETFYEIGTIPTSKKTTLEKKERAVTLLKEGKTLEDIVNEDSSYAYDINKLKPLQELVLAEKARTIRDVKVIYLYGNTGTGKTRHIFNNHDIGDICRVTNYGTKSTGVRFDAYEGQDILVFEEFRSQIPISDMLNYLDIYPIKLPARYTDRSALYTTVYITSNEPLERQYTDVQHNSTKTWAAFLRRIDKVIEVKTDNEFVDVTAKYKLNMKG